MSEATGGDGVGKLGGDYRLSKLLDWFNIFVWMTQYEVSRPITGNVDLYYEPKELFNLNTTSDGLGPGGKILLWA